MEKFDAIDWNKVDLAEKVSIEFNEIISAFQNNFQQSFKRWRQSNTNLQAKYENISVWIRAFSEMNSKLKDEFLTSQAKNRLNFGFIIDFFSGRN